MLTYELGGLYVQSREGKLPQIFPLKHTEVKARITGNVSRVEVTQTFENPFTKPLEAIYVFPLPDEAAVDDMEIQLGTRLIKGYIKKREEAQKIYEQAKQEGRTAGLLEQERDNIFTQSLANIRPGEQIDVTIRYTDSLKFVSEASLEELGGNYEFVFPMVVGPRFIPGIPIDGSGDTDEVPDASRINPGMMPPGTRSGHDIGVTLEIDAGVMIRDVRSPSHQLKIEQEDAILRVQLKREDTIPNKDLIVRYRVAGENTRAAVLKQSDERGGHFAVYLIPALEYHPNEIVPKDVVFLIDTSGSQAGDPLLKSQELMRRFITGLNPNDTFTIVDFANTATHLSPAPLPNTPKNRALAFNYINQLQANGGTYLLNGIKAVINFPAAPTGRLRSIVLLTDGYIGNENEVLAEVQRQLRTGNRLYSFGVGSSVNRFLLNRIAEVGRGTCQVVCHNESAEEVAEQFFRQINNPVLTNIQISWEGVGDAPVIYPSTPPDLFAEQPLVLFGRKPDSTAGKLHIRGIAAGVKHYEKTFNLTFDESENPAIAQMWGRARIKDLMQEMFRVETKAGVEAVTETALAYQLLSQYTAFVAVSDQVRVEPESDSISMHVPVEMPEAVNLQGTLTHLAAYAGSLPTQLMRSALPVPPAARMRSAPAAPSLAPSGQLFPQTAVSKKGGIFDRAKDAVREMLGQNPSASADVDRVCKQLESEEVSPSTPTSLEVISITGLEPVATADLTQQLHQLSLPAGCSGKIVFEFTVAKGRVGRVMLDEEASTLTDSAVIDIIKRALISWLVPQDQISIVRLTLRIL